MTFLETKGVFKFGPYMQPEEKSHDAQHFFYIIIFEVIYHVIRLVSK
jgi:hypothetical protein